MAKVDLRLVSLQVERFGSVCYTFTLTYKIFFCLGWNGQNISKYTAEGTETNQTIGEKSNSNEETIMTLLRENPRRYMFWPEDTSNKPYINAKTIENNVQAKVDIAEDRIWTDDLEEAVGNLKENVVIVPKTENEPIMGEIKAEPINLTSNFDEDFYNKDNEKISANVSVTYDGSNDKAATINDSPLKIEYFFDQLSKKNSVVINDFNTQFSNDRSFRAQLANSPTTTFTATSSTTTRTTSSTTTTTTTTKPTPTTMTILTSISTSSTATTI